MKTRIAAFLRLFIPYGLLLLLRYLRRYKTSIVYDGDYSSWSEAESAADGYGSDAIIEKVFASTNAVLRGEAVYERDSWLFYREEYNWAFICALSRIRLFGCRQLHLVDFGGALGSSYWQNKKQFDMFSEVDWHVVEQKSFLDASAKLKYTAPLTFEESIGESFSKYPINVVLFSSVLQYIKNFQDILNDTFSHSPEFIIIDRTPLFTEGTVPQILVESVPETIYPATYACEFRLKDEFLQIFLQSGYELIMQWDSNIDPAVVIRNRSGQKRTATFFGFLFRKINERNLK